MKLSVVIVNYNVAMFLEQCLISVNKAGQDIDFEIFVVDNASVDHSVEMLRSRFPEVNLIENSKNIGFGKANNQAIRLCKGEFILLLNPDTVLQEDTLNKCISHMNKHPECGALGVYMLDGQGNYLPESKRGLPIPRTAFFKISGLNKLFPKSKILNHYYLGHLDHNKNQKIEILAGAFMFIRKSTIETVGDFDEQFFMYGEDIDLSYRILQASFENHYLAETRIIHYKGESTKKGSLNYVFVFYQAMALFAQKHFLGLGGNMYLKVIQLAIWSRAGLAVLYRWAKTLHLPILDAGFMYAGMWGITRYWEMNHRFVSGGGYPPEFMQLVVPIYIIIWQFSLFLGGGYDRPIRLSKMQSHLLWASISMLAIYGLLNDDYRFSRALLLLGSVWALSTSSILRLTLESLFGSYLRTSQNLKKAWLVGSVEGNKRLKNLVQLSRPNVFITGETLADEYGIPVQKLSEIIRTLGINEIIFDAASLKNNDILDAMVALNQDGLEMKIAPEAALFIIGSSSIHTQGEWYNPAISAIEDATFKRNKRLIDILLCLVILPVSQLFSILSTHSKFVSTAAKQVLLGNATWVGFALRLTPAGSKSRKAIFHPGGKTMLRTDILELLTQIDMLYARECSHKNDLSILWKNLFNTTN